MPSDVESLISRLEKLETGQLSDVLDEAGLANTALAPEFRPVAGGARFAGVAVCARGEPLVQTREPRRAKFPVDALDRAIAPGSVLMLGTGGFMAGACLGGLMAYSFQRNGCRGVVVDGLIRDAEEIDGFGLPVRARGTTPINSARRWSLVDVGGPLSLPGAAGPAVAVASGDYVVGDADGVVVVPQAVAASIVEDAEELARIEARIAAALRAGGDRAEVFAANRRFDHVRSVV